MSYFQDIGKKNRNALFAAAAGTLLLGPLGAVGVTWAAHHFTKEDDDYTTENESSTMNPNIVEFAVWNGDKLEGVVDKDKITNVLSTMKVNMSDDELSQIKIGCRWGNGSHTDKPNYMTFDHAYNLYGPS